MALDIDTVFRDNVIKGDIHSGAHEIDKAEVRQGLKSWFGAASNPAIVKQTRAALVAVTPASENYGGMVINDPDPTKNGYYYRDSAAWVKGRGLPDTFAVLTSVAGTANAITASVEAGVNPADTKLLLLVPTAGNTGAVTLSVSGETPVSLRDVNGDELTAGLLAGGRAVLVWRDGSNYRLASDPDADAAAASAAASASAANDDRLAAETARDEAEAIVGFDGTAVTVDYDNSTSGLTATDAQAAIDELDGRIDGIEGDYLPLAGGTVTGQVIAEEGVVVAGTVSGGTIASASSTFEIQNDTDVGMSWHRTGAASTVNEMYIAGFAKDDGGTVRKTMSISEVMIDSTEANRCSVVRINASYANAGVGTDYIGVRVWGGKGVTIDGLGEVDHPHQYSTSYKLLIRAQTLHVLPGTGANTHFNFMNGGGANGVGSTCGTIVSNGSATAYNTSSDQRLKEDDGEVTFEEARTILDLIAFHNFRWKETGEAAQGVFAQELYQVYPAAVTQGTGELGETGFMPWQVDYSKLVTVIAKCVQGVMARQDAFDERLAALEAGN